jgi:hypothetical protein
MSTTIVRSRRGAGLRDLIVPVLVGILVGVGIVYALVTVGPFKPAQVPTQATTTVQEVRAKEDPFLYQYGWVDKSKGIAHIPVSRAIDIVAQQPLPSRPAPAQPAKDQGLTIPSYSSSGTQSVTGLH